MKQNFKNGTTLLMISGVMTLFLGACGGQSVNQTNSTQGASPKLLDASGVKHFQSDDGSVRVDELRMTAEQIANARALYQRTDLIQLPTDAKYNAQVFRITDLSIDDYKNKAFIAPKLYCYGSEDGGKLAPIYHHDGTVTLAFNVVFLDGIGDKFYKPNGIDTANTPDLIKVQDREGLKSVLKNTYGTDNGLAPLPGCPKKLVLTAAGKEYDATPTLFRNSDHCQLNIPTTVSLTVSEDDAKLITNIALPANTVDLSAVYETRVAIPTSKVTIHFDRSKIYRELKAELGVRAWVVDASAKIAASKVIKNQLMNVSIQGQTSDLVAKLIDKITDEFFEPYVALPAAVGNSPCGLEAACLRLSSTTLDQSNEMTFEWVQESNMMSGQNYLTMTKLKATPDTVRIGDSGCEETENLSGNYVNGQCNRLTNDRSPREIMPVVDGNQITITPSYLIEQQITIPSPIAVRTHHEVCTNERRVCLPLCHGFSCLANFSNTANIESADSCGTVCDSHEDHFVDVTNYSTPARNSIKLQSSVGQLNELFDGLRFGFKWHDQASNTEKYLECPTSVFPRSGDGSSLTLQLKNMPNCKPFTGTDGETPMLYLMNNIHATQNYIVGTRSVTWTGSVSDTTSTAVFSPAVDFAGSITISGFQIESATSGGQLQ